MTSRDFSQYDTDGESFDVGQGNYDEVTGQNVERRDPPPRFFREAAGGGSMREMADTTLGRPTSAWGVDDDEFRVQYREGLYGATVDQPTGSFSPLYDDRFARRYLNTLSSAALAALEDRMWRAGYNVVEEGTGLRSSNLITAFQSLVVEANNNRTSWDTQLNENIRLWQESEEDRRKAAYTPWQAPDYLKPDYAYLSQSVKATIRGNLGREASAAEMRVLMSNLESQHRLEYDQEFVPRARSEWESNGRAALGEETPEGRTIQDIDPVARFNEFFEQRYEGEMDHRQRVDQVQQHQGSLFSGMDMAARMVGR